MKKTIIPEFDVADRAILHCGSRCPNLSRFGVKQHPARAPFRGLYRCETAVFFARNHGAFGAKPSWFHRETALARWETDENGFRLKFDVKFQLHAPTDEIR